MQIKQLEAIYNCMEQGNTETAQGMLGLLIEMEKLEAVIKKEGSEK